MSELQIPVFPLNAVLFPGGPLQLRVFEPRYLDMVSRCLREERNFGVVLIRDGTETAASSIHPVGTMASIADWYQGKDGLLGITVIGQGRFRLDGTTRQQDRLLLGQATPLASDPESPLPERYTPMVRLLRAVLKDAERRPAGVPDASYGNAAWVSWRLAEVLPVAMQQRQEWLEIDDPVERLGRIQPVLDSLRK